MNKRLAAAAVLSAAIGGSMLGPANAVSAHEGGAHHVGGAHEVSAKPLSITPHERHQITEATKEFRSVDKAVAAGYLATDECVSLPGVGGMGYHYVNPGLFDNTVDMNKPEAMLYEKRSNGELRLIGIEYFKVDADQNLATDDDRPSLFGEGFEGPMPGHSPEMPIHYDRHVWLYKHNPDGMLATWNPRVTCPASTPGDNELAGLVYDGDPNHVVDGHKGYIRDDDPLHQVLKFH